MSLSLGRGGYRDKYYIQLGKCFPLLCCETLPQLYKSYDTLVIMLPVHDFIGW